MSQVHVVPIMDAIYHPGQCFKDITLVIKNQTNIVGEAHITLLNCKKMEDEGKTLRNVASMVAEDMHFAFTALSKQDRFSCIISCGDDMQCRTPIIAYLSRIYIFPKYRRQGFAEAFVRMIPEIVENITMSAPLAVAVYVSPQSKEQNGENDTHIDLTNKEQQEMCHHMKHLFQKCGYFYPSKEKRYARCLCWVEEK